MTKSINLPYGHEQRAIQIPERNLAWISGPKQVPPMADLRGAVTTAIRQPIGSGEGWAGMVVRSAVPKPWYVAHGVHAGVQVLIRPFQQRLVRAARPV